MGFKSNDWCVYKRTEEVWIQRHRPCVNRSRDWSDRATNQRIPKTAGHYQKIKEKQGRILSLNLQKEGNTDDTLILNI
jgi:hypothetical protein